MQAIATFKSTPRQDPTTNCNRRHVGGRSKIQLQDIRFQRDIRLNCCPAQTIHP